MNLNEISQPKSDISHVVQMVRNHFAEESFVSKFVLSVSNSHERLGGAMDNIHVKCQIWRHASSPCFKAVCESPKLDSIAHKLMCAHSFITVIVDNYCSKLRMHGKSFYARHPAHYMWKCQI